MTNNIEYGQIGDTADYDSQHDVTYSSRIESPGAAKVFRIEKKVGDSVFIGERVITIQALGMEVPINATEEGVISSIDVKEGQLIDKGTLIVTIQHMSSM